MQIPATAILDVMAFDRRRRPCEFVAWQVMRANAADPWLPGDRFRLYRVGRSNTFRLEHAPVAVNRLRACFRRTMMPLGLLIRAVEDGRWVQLDESTLMLKMLPRDGDDSLADALR